MCPSQWYPVLQWNSVMAIHHICIKGQRITVDVQELYMSTIFICQSIYIYFDPRKYEYQFDSN